MSILLPVYLCYISITEYLYAAVISYLVSTNSDEGSLEEDAKLCQCACSKSVSLYVSSILSKIWTGGLRVPYIP